MFTYKENILYVEETPVPTIIESHGTPCYIYSQAMIQKNWKRYDEALQSHLHHIHYAVKANDNLAILQLLVELGSGFDIVSGGELARVIEAGGDPDLIIFSGVGKTSEEIQQALKANIHAFHVESFDELKSIEEQAELLSKKAPISIRVNPDISANTNSLIATGKKENKFGVPVDEAYALYDYAAASSHLTIKGISCHIGSQITELDSFVRVLKQILLIHDALAKKNIVLKYIDVGGGLGISIKGESILSIEDYCAGLLKELKDRDILLKIEPGRSIVANTGILVGRVQCLKQNGDKRFAILDTGMNDLIRPALYNAFHPITSVKIRDDVQEARYEIDGPVCETSDCFGKDYLLKIKLDDLLAIHNCGAYGSVMSSNYNSRLRPVEVLVDKDQVHLIRQRETIEDLIARDILLPKNMPFKKIV